jgi:hypothetical protein
MARRIRKITVVVVGTPPPLPPLVDEVLRVWDPKQREGRGPARPTRSEFPPIGGVADTTAVGRRFHAVVRPLAD